MTLPQRLDSHSIPEPNSGCYLWTGRLNAGGYGTLKYAGRSLLAHRAAWTEKHGPIPAGLKICHRCDMPSCVNPDHLWLGTQADNIADCVQKGRVPIGDQRRPQWGEQNASVKLTNEQVAAIRVDPRFQRDIARAYGISQSNVSLIKAGKSRPHLTPHH